MRKFAALLLLSIASPALASFSLRQTGCANKNNTNATTVSCTFGSAPTQHDLVVCGMLWLGTSTGSSPPASISFADGNSNAYTKTANSPGHTNFPVYIWYLLDAPANASATLTATFSTTGTGGASALWCDDFAVSGAQPTFDLDAVGSGNSSSLTSPTVGVTNTGELLYSYACPNGNISAIGGGWTEGGGAPALPASLVDGQCSGYILSANANTAVNFTADSSGVFDAIAASFTQGAAGVVVHGRGKMKMLDAMDQ